VEPYKKRHQKESRPFKIQGTIMNKPVHNKKNLKVFRKKLRNDLTPAEAKLWWYLKDRQLAGQKFRRQYSIGNYILDFYCPAKKVAIELDGEVHNNQQQACYDEKKNLFLTDHGIEVLRFENKLVFKNPEGILNAIKERLNSANAVKNI
jgi:very-short-patch-repair endonuclease